MQWFIAGMQWAIALGMILSAFKMRTIRRHQESLSGQTEAIAKTQREISQLLADHAEQHAEAPTFADLQALRDQLQRHTTSNLLHAADRRD